MQNLILMTVNYFLGIDPAYRENGNALAIYSPAKNAIFVSNFLDLRGLTNYLKQIAQDKKGFGKVVFVENSLLQSESFTKLDNSHLSNLWVKAVSVGKNQAISEAVALMCENVFFPFDLVREISPKEKGAKLTEGELKKYAGRLGVPNFDLKILPQSSIQTITQDALDAAKCALLGYLAYKNAYMAAAFPTCNNSIKDLVLNGNLSQIKPIFETVPF